MNGERLPVTASVAPTDLLGGWKLHRRLVDRRTGQFGRVTGRLDLSMAGSVVRWVERGRLLWDGGRFDVSRELHIAPDGEGWVVHFADGRVFHPWRPGEVVEHPCADDLYRGLVCVDPARTVVRVLWDVAGPSKDQRIVTRCRRS